MDLDAQITDLVQGAPGNGLPAGTVEAIAPTLKAIAGQLKHDQYYILQTLEQGWVLTTLSSREQPDVRKKCCLRFPLFRCRPDWLVFCKRPPGDGPADAHYPHSVSNAGHEAST